MTLLLSGKVALVAGATRGAGRGIAVELGAVGATVYCTGRSTRNSPSSMNRPETIEETAELVTRAGGVGIAVRCDHSSEEQVNSLLEQIKAEQGRLHLLVNDIWGGEKRIEWGKRFWELDWAQGLALIQQSLFTHMLTSRHAVPLMLETVQYGGKGGLVLEITDGDTDVYRGNLIYDFIKNGVIRLARGMAADLDGQPLAQGGGGVGGSSDAKITVVALTPGFLRSEEMLEAFGVAEENWLEGAKKDPFFAGSETPHFIGRAVVALACDPKVHAKHGQALATWHLSREYGFTDVDGRSPHWLEFFEAEKVRQSALEG